MSDNPYAVLDRLEFASLKQENVALKARVLELEAKEAKRKAKKRRKKDAKEGYAIMQGWNGNE